MCCRVGDEEAWAYLTTIEATRPLADVCVCCRVGDEKEARAYLTASEATRPLAEGCSRPVVDCWCVL